MKTVKATISGRVQGVGFRYFVKMHADDLNLKGSARNLADGRVEVLLQGASENIEQLFNKLKQGPRFSSVSSVEMTECENAELFNQFNTG
ncbi:MAG: acylphosphatase [Gammaproteobacteria bacterium]|nr:acylphosphatase [Gammaproteobacteria bacterium]